MHPYLLADIAEGASEVVEQVGDIIETAGNKAGSIFSRLPALTSRVLMAALFAFIGIIAVKQVY